MRTSSKIVGVAILVLLIFGGVVWHAAIQADQQGTLAVSFLPAGKTGAVLIRAPSGRTALIDGGSDASILRSLGAALLWYTRSIDVLIEAHPDTLHATGLIDVLERFRVQSMFRSSAEGSGPVMQTLAHSIAETEKKGTRVATLQRRDVIDLGAGAFIEILFPDRDLSRAPASVGCIEMKVVYGSTSFMLSCGMPAVEDYLVRLNGLKLHADVLSVDGGMGTSSRLFAGFVGAKAIAHIGDTFISDGTSVRLVE